MNKYTKLPPNRLIANNKHLVNEEVRTLLEKYNTIRDLPTGIKTQEIILKAPSLRTQMIKKMGGKCVICGFEDERALQLDHINGHGSKDPKRQYDTRYGWILNNLGEAKLKYQILCANCNWIKRYENNESPSRIDTIDEEARQLWNRVE